MSDRVNDRDRDESNGSADCAGTLAFLATAGGWLAVHYTTRIRELEARDRADRLKRIEIALGKTEKQIESFYGPLYSLIQQVWIVYGIRERIIEHLSPADNQGKDPAEIKGDIDKFVWQEFFLPLHEEMRSILKDRLHLIEGTRLSPSFEKYLEHATIEKVRNKLFERGISTASVPAIFWTNEFPEDVKRELDAAMRRYETYLSEIKPQLGESDGRRAG
jgi:hypothetical protein